MVQSALGAVGEQMRQAAEQVADVQSRAQAVIEGNSQLQERLGGSVRCMAPISQSSMTQVRHLYPMMTALCAYMDCHGCTWRSMWVPHPLPCGSVNVRTRA